MLFSLNVANALSNELSAVRWELSRRDVHMPPKMLSLKKQGSAGSWTHA